MEIFTILRSFFDLDFMDDVKYPLFYDFMRKNKIIHMHISIYKNFKFNYKMGFLFFTICFIFVCVLFLFLFYRSASMDLKQKVCLGMVAFVIILFLSISVVKRFRILRELAFVGDVVFLFMSSFVVFYNLKNLEQSSMTTVKQKIFLLFNILTILFLVVYLIYCYREAFLRFTTILTNLNDLERAFAKISVMNMT